ncbi:uncharacterized protein LOC129725549 isoform X2 [Wyeomyia smithii]|uniref:uncharacterized protein LOC129725549 isoform X2 n=1 Tax=Wyeomyia smithii TaxID=174621 RepID=UPI002467F459|nr:uncharacterized protein LOC129725549 isoform X2 [Wyeomyia smithii]
MRPLDRAAVLVIAAHIMLLAQIHTSESSRVKRQSNRSPFSVYSAPLKNKFVRNRPLPSGLVTTIESVQPTTFSATPVSVNNFNGDLSTILTRRPPHLTLPPPFEAEAPSRSREFYSCMSSCLTLSHYNPVCGTDHTTYHNVYKLDCANRCGARPSVRVRKPGIC